MAEQMSSNPSYPDSACSTLALVPNSAHPLAYYEGSSVKPLCPIGTSASGARPAAPLGQRAFRSAAAGEEKADIGSTPPEVTSRAPGSLGYPLSQRFLFHAHHLCACTLFLGDPVLDAGNRMWNKAEKSPPPKMFLFY